MKVFIVGADQIAQSDITRSVFAFCELTGQAPKEVGEVVVAQGGLHNPQGAHKEGIIYKYRTGQLADEVFYEKMSLLIGLDPRAPGVREKFWKAWNSMYDLSEETLAGLRRIEKSCKEHDFRLHIIADSGPSQWVYLQEQLKNGKFDLSISSTRSYDEGTLDPALLLERAKNRLRQVEEVIDLRGEKNPLLVTLSARARDRDSERVREEKNAQKQPRPGK